jgi:hypothetical protein
MNCEICLDPIVNPVNINCIHKYCIPCLDDWHKTNPHAEHKCMICSTKYNRGLRRRYTVRKNDVKVRKNDIKVRNEIDDLYRLGYRQCPKCTAWIERVNGCMGVTCICKHRFVHDGVSKIDHNFNPKQPVNIPTVRYCNRDMHETRLASMVLITIIVLLIYFIHVTEYESDTCLVNAEYKHYDNRLNHLIGYSRSVEEIINLSSKLGLPVIDHPELLKRAEEEISIIRETMKTIYKEIRQYRRKYLYATVPFLFLILFMGNCIGLYMSIIPIRNINWVDRFYQ